MQLKPALVQVMQPNTSASSVQTRRQSASASALPSSSANAVMQAVSQNENLTAASRRQVVEMAARVDQANLPTAESATLFAELSTMAVYIPEGESPKIPNWSHLTGLRYYNGINAGSSQAENFEHLGQAITRLKEDLAVQNTQPPPTQVVQAPVQQVQQVVAEPPVVRVEPVAQKPIQQEPAKQVAALKQAAAQPVKAPAVKVDIEV